MEREAADLPRRPLDELTVIIPVKDEAEAIGAVLDEVLGLGLPPERVVVVDGRSSDDTREIAERKGVVVLVQRGNGKADAVAEGLRVVRTKYVAVMDGDHTYPAEHLPELLRKAEEDSCDEVIGARAWGRENIPRLNRVGNRIITETFNALYGTRLRDLLSGMYLLRTEALRSAIFEMSGFSVEAEVAAHIVGSGGKICEAPIKYRERLGRKKLRAFHGVKIFVDVLRLVWRYNPVVFLLALTSLLLLPGLALGVYVGYHYIFANINFYVKGIIAVVLTSIGLVSLELAAIGVYLRRMELRLTKLLRSCDE
ncbi:MAG: glycosyltransferase family 2 protein [Desulfurococcaceae archaeon]